MQFPGMNCRELANILLGMGITCLLLSFFSWRAILIITGVLLLGSGLAVCRHRH